MECICTQAGCVVVLGMWGCMAAGVVVVRTCGSVMRRLPLTLCIVVCVLDVHLLLVLLLLLGVLESICMHTASPRGLACAWFGSQGADLPPCPPDLHPLHAPPVTHNLPYHRLTWRSTRAGPLLIRSTCADPRVEGCCTRADIAHRLIQRCSVDRPSRSCAALPLVPHRPRHRSQPLRHTPCGPTPLGLTISCHRRPR